MLCVFKPIAGVYIAFDTIFAGFDYVLPRYSTGEISEGQSEESLLKKMKGTDTNWIQYVDVECTQYLLYIL